MTRTTTVARVILALALAGQAVPALAQREAMLVTPAWLAQHLQDANLVLLHVGDQPDYATAHIPGARFVTLPDVTTTPAGTPPLSLEMSPPDTLRAQLSALGVSDNSHVVVYYAKDRVSATTRIAFTLRYAGLTNVSILDGGMGAWTKQGHEVTAVVPPARPGTLSAFTPKPLVVDAAFVQAHLAAPGTSSSTRATRRISTAPRLAVRPITAWPATSPARTPRRSAR